LDDHHFFEPKAGSLGSLFLTLQQTFRRNHVVGGGRPYETWFGPYDDTQMGTVTSVHGNTRPSEARYNLIDYEDGDIYAQVDPDNPERNVLL
jgi:hypothetical protein